MTVNCNLVFALTHHSCSPPPPPPPFQRLSPCPCIFYHRNCYPVDESIINVTFFFLLSSLSHVIVLVTFGSFFLSFFLSLSLCLFNSFHFSMTCIAIEKATHTPYTDTQTWLHIFTQTRVDVFTCISIFLFLSSFSCSFPSFLPSLVIDLSLIRQVCFLLLVICSFDSLLNIFTHQHILTWEKEEEPSHRYPRVKKHVSTVNQFSINQSINVQSSCPVDSHSNITHVSFFNCVSHITANITCLTSHFMRLSPLSCVTPSSPYARCFFLFLSVTCVTYFYSSPINTCLMDGYTF